jgi:putative FmdB family regulatory protein
MPTYEYLCQECGHEFDAVQTFEEPSLTVCPQCGGPLRKKFGSIGVVFKGPGFYRTDSREKPAEARSSKQDGTKKESSGQKEGGAKGEAKSTGKSDANRNSKSDSKPKSDGGPKRNGGSKSEGGSKSDGGSKSEGGSKSKSVEK